MKKIALFLNLVALVGLSACSSGEATSSDSISSGDASISDNSSTSESSSEESSSTYVPSGFSLTWSDEFDGEELDSSNWTYEIGNGSWGWGNNELEYYTSDNATVNDGYLTIEARKEEMGGFRYTSSRIKTAGKFYQTYGYFEARIKLPAQNAMWPAFWMMPEVSSWPTTGEIDIMEAKGASPSGTSCALHYANESGHQYVSYSHTWNRRLGEDTTIEDFHVYAVDWSEEEFVFYVDGEAFYTAPRRTWHPDGGIYAGAGDAPFNKDFYIILNLAVGGNFDSAHTEPDSDFESAQMVIDYVRAYEYVG